MKRFSHLLTAILLFAISQMSSAQVIPVPDQANCQANCAQFQIVGSTLVATLLDKNGTPFKVVSHELGENARPVNDGIGNIRDGQVQPMDTAQVSYTKYVTTTQTVFVTTTIIYNNRGEIVDIKITEIRVPRGQQEK